MMTTLLAQATNPTVPQTPALERVAGSGIVPACATDAGGADTLDCVLQLFINVADILLGVVGAVFLAVLVWGGILYLTSQGESSKISKGTNMMLGSFVGLLIVFGAFAAVTYGVQAIRGGQGNSIAPAQYVTCGSTEQPENNGLPCGPTSQCNAGVCVQDDPLTVPSEGTNASIWGSGTAPAFAPPDLGDITVEDELEENILIEEP